MTRQETRSYHLTFTYKVFGQFMHVNVFVIKSGYICVCVGYMDQCKDEAKKRKYKLIDDRLMYDYIALLFMLIYLF